MRRRTLATLATATTLLLTATACGGDDEPEDVDSAAGTSTSDEVSTVPVERSTDLVDAGGSILGTAWLREAENGGAEIEVQTAGLTQGFHGMYLVEAASCDAVDDGSASVVLSPVLVLENGIGSITTLVGPVDLADLLDVEGPTIVIADAVATPDGVAASAPGSRVACGSFTR